LPCRARGSPSPPKPWYLYRRHAASTSHRLTPEQAAAILAGIDALARDHPDLGRNRGGVRCPKRGAHPDGAPRAFGELVARSSNGKGWPRQWASCAAPVLSADLLRAMWEGHGTPAASWAASDTRPLILSAAARDGDIRPFFAVPETAKAGMGPRGRLARLTGSGARHLRAVGRPGLAALGMCPAGDWPS
jgi:hypothetical protein